MAEFCKVKDANTLDMVAFVKKLNTKFLGLFPVLDWKLDLEMIQKLKNADVILIDSPYYTPFRESTLWTSLKFGNGIIILDDTQIPTLQKFCDRLLISNKSLFHRRIKVGHQFDLFHKTSKKKLYLNHSLKDIIKGWFRYFQGLKFYYKLK